MRSGPVPGGAQATPDPNLESAVHGTWGDPCHERETGFYGEDRGGQQPAATPRDPNPATGERRARTAQPAQSLRPAVGATTAAVQGCSGVLAPEASGPTKRTRRLAQIESGIRTMQLARRRSLLNVSDADLQLRSRNEAAAACRRGLFTESARLAQIRRHTPASAAPPPARGTASEPTGNNTPGTHPATSPQTGQCQVADAASPTPDVARDRTTIASRGDRARSSRNPRVLTNWLLARPGVRHPDGQTNFWPQGR